jgi:hypothetical protein
MRRTTTVNYDESLHTSPPDTLHSAEKKGLTLHPTAKYIHKGLSETKRRT